MSRFRPMLRRHGLTEQQWRVIRALAAYQEIDASELQAVCFQHEIDHLNGILFIDHVSRLKRGLYVKKRKKQLRLELEEAAGS